MTDPAPAPTRPDGIATIRVDQFLPARPAAVGRALRLVPVVSALG